MYISLVDVELEQALELDRGAARGRNKAAGFQVIFIEVIALQQLQLAKFTQYRFCYTW